MQFLKKHIVFRYFWLFMALHILNCSVDSPDAHPDYVPEDLAYNDIESISELVLEQILGFENAVAEHDEHDTEEGASFGVAKILLYCQSSFEFSIKRISLRPYLKNTPLNYEQTFISQFHPDIVSPPPQQV